MLVDLISIMENNRQNGRFENIVEGRQCDYKTFIDIVDKYYNYNLGFGIYKPIFYSFYLIL